MIWPRPVTLANARVVTSQGESASIRFSRRVLGLGERARRGDHVIDVNGAWVLPGLINAHDHLELNHYGPQHAAAPYQNVQQWVDDMRSRLHEDPHIAAGRARPLAARVWAGGFKNLLSGVTLVAHHNPIYPRMQRSSPVRMLDRFGWAHSFAMEREPVGAHGEPGGNVAERFMSTPRAMPFVVHLAEGVDAAAQSELRKLDDAAALADNTVIVHGVAIDAEGWRHVGAQGAGAVWCPASNLALFGTTLRIREAMGALKGRLALGTDSRLSGSRDLLDELRVAVDVAPLTSAERLSLVTTSAAAVLRCPSAGLLAPGLPADLIVIPARDTSPGNALSACRRHDLQLVVTDGRPRLGLPEWEPLFRARGVSSAPMRLDGQARVADHGLRRASARFGIDEEGVEWLH